MRSNILQFIAIKISERLNFQRFLQLPECLVATTMFLAGNKGKLFIIRNIVKRTKKFD